MNDPFRDASRTGTHTVEVRNGRNSSRTKTFDVADGETVAFRCSGKNILPIFLLSFVVPSLALSLHRERTHDNEKARDQAELDQVVEFDSPEVDTPRDRGRSISRSRTLRLVVLPSTLS